MEHILNDLPNIRIDESTGLIIANDKYFIDPKRGYVTRPEVALRHAGLNRRVRFTNEGYYIEGDSINMLSEDATSSMLGRETFDVLEHFRSGQLGQVETKLWNIFDELDDMESRYHNLQKESQERSLNESMLSTDSDIWLDESRYLYSMLEEDARKLTHLERTIVSGLKSHLNFLPEDTLSEIKTAIGTASQALNEQKKELEQQLDYAVQFLNDQGLINEDWFDDLTDTVSTAIDSAGDTAKNVAGAVKDTVSSTTDKVSKTYDKVKSTIKSAGGKAASGVKSVVNKIKDTFGNVTKMILTGARKVIKEGLKFVLRVFITPIVAGKTVVDSIMSGKFSFKETLGAMTLSSAIILGSAIPFMSPIIASIAVVGKDMMPEWVAKIISEAEKVTSDVAEKVLGLCDTILSWAGTVVKDMFSSPRNAAHSIVDIVSLLLQLAGPATGGITAIIAMVIEIVHGLSYFIESMFTEDDGLKWECWLVGGITLVLGATGMHFALVGAKRGLQQGAKVLAKEAAQNAGKVSISTIKRVIKEALPKAASKVVTAVMEFLANPLQVIKKLAGMIKKTKFGRFLFTKLGGKKALARAEKEGAKMTAHNADLIIKAESDDVVKAVGKEAAEKVGTETTKDGVTMLGKSGLASKVAKGTDDAVTLGLVGMLGYDLWSGMTQESVTSLTPEQSVMMRLFETKDEMTPDMVDKINSFMDKNLEKVDFEKWGQEPKQFKQNLFNFLDNLDFDIKDITDKNKKFTGIFKESFKDFKKKFKSMGTTNPEMAMNMLEHFNEDLKFSFLRKQAHDDMLEYTKANEERLSKLEPEVRRKEIVKRSGLNDETLEHLKLSNNAMSIAIGDEVAPMSSTKAIEFRADGSPRKGKVVYTGEKEILTKKEANKKAAKSNGRLSQINEAFNSSVANRFENARTHFKQKGKLWKGIKKWGKLILIGLFIIGVFGVGFPLLFKRLSLIGEYDLEPVGSESGETEETEETEESGETGDTMVSTNTIKDSVDAFYKECVNFEKDAKKASSEEVEEMSKQLIALNAKYEKLKKQIEEAKLQKTSVMATLNKCKSLLDLANKHLSGENVTTEENDIITPEPVTQEAFFETETAKTVISISGRVAKKKDESGDDARLEITVGEDKFDNLKIKNEQEADPKTMQTVFAMIYDSMGKADDYSWEEVVKNDEDWLMVGDPRDTMVIEGDMPVEFFLVMNTRSSLSLRKKRFNFKRSLKRLVLDGSTGSDEQEAPIEGMWKVTNISDKSRNKKDTLFFVYRLKSTDKKN